MQEKQQFYISCKYIVIWPLIVFAMRFYVFARRLFYCAEVKYFHE